MAIIQFEDGTKVEFNGTPTAKDVEDVHQSLLKSKAATPAATPEKSFYQRNIVEPFNNFSAGFAKGEVSTLKGVGTLGQTILDKTVNKIPGVNMGDDIYRKGSATENSVSNFLAPNGTAQGVGYGTEKIAELFAPATKIARGEKAIDLLINGRGLLPAAERIVAKGAVSALGTGGVVAAQSGSFKAGAEAGAISGGVRGGMAVIGEGARALRLPERLYSTIFKNSAKDMISELKSGGLATLQANNPERFQELVSKGIIKVAKDGSPIVNDTLAEQAIDKGLRGSIRHMSDEVVHGALDSEDKVQTIANNHAGKINLSEPQFQNVLKKIATEYEDVGFGEISDEANNLADTLKNSKGGVDANVALQVRRFLDRVRIATSFDKPVVNLSTSQGNLKTLADAVRSRVNSIPGMGEAMKDYAFHIDALEALAREAARRGNNQVVSMIDSVFLSGAYAGNNPAAGVTMGMIRKLLTSPSGATYLGQALKNSSASRLTSGLVSSGSAGGQSLLGDQ